MIMQNLCMFITFSCYMHELLITVIIIIGGTKINDTETVANQT